MLIVNIILSVDFVFLFSFKICFYWMPPGIYLPKSIYYYSWKFNLRGYEQMLREHKTTYKALTLLNLCISWIFDKVINHTVSVDNLYLIRLTHQIHDGVTRWTWTKFNCKGIMKLAMRYHWMRNMNHPTSKINSCTVNNNNV